MYLDFSMVNLNLIKDHLQNRNDCYINNYNCLAANCSLERQDSAKEYTGEQVNVLQQAGVNK